MTSPYSGFTTTLLNNVDATVRHFTQSSYQAIVQSHETEIYLALVLYIAFFGYQVLMGDVELSIPKAASRVLFVGTVVALATHWDYFALFFNDVFTNGPAKMIAAISNGSYDPNTMLSDIFDKGMIGAYQINQNAGVFTMGFLVIGYSVFYCTLFVVSYALFLLILTKLALGILLGLAPLFFMLLLFDTTKHFFALYVRQVFNFAMVPVFTSAILSLMLGIVNDAVTRLQMTLATHTGHGGPECVYVILCLIVLWLLLHQVMGLASGIAGGLQLDHGNFASLAAGVALGRAQLHATQTKDNLGTIGLKTAHRSGWTIGKVRKAFKKKSTPEAVA